MTAIGQFLATWILFYLIFAVPSQTKYFHKIKHFFGFVLFHPVRVSYVGQSEVPASITTIFFYTFSTILSAQYKSFTKKT